MKPQEIVRRENLETRAGRDRTVRREFESSSDAARQISKGAGAGETSRPLRSPDESVKDGAHREPSGFYERHADRARAGEVTESMRITDGNFRSRTANGRSWSARAQRAFADEGSRAMNGEAPSRERSHDDRSHITIHSSPTLVIQSHHPSNIEQLVQAALGRHHEELIDRVIREASRRERAEY